MNLLCEGGLHVACDGVFYEEMSLRSRRCHCDCHDDAYLRRSSSETSSGLPARAKADETASASA